jgi:hypothetical protein
LSLGRLQAVFTSTGMTVGVSSLSFSGDYYAYQEFMETATE